MKRYQSWIAPLALGLALGTVQIAPAFQAQSQNPSGAQQEQQDQQKTQTFVGKVIKTRNGQFALLTDEQNGKGVYLDDTDKVQPFEGKTVKVTGTLEVAKNLVHVASIEAA
jgi:Protein of unknown function (DUF5818)